MTATPIYKSKNTRGGGVLLYEEIVAKVREMIKVGTYLPGERIPSVRTLSRQMRVSVNTVMEAYLRLENAGLIEARPRSGYYVCAPQRQAVCRQASGAPLPAIVPSPVTIDDAALQVMQAIGNPKLVPLGSGVPNIDLLPIDRLNRMLGSESKRFPLQSVAYPSARGHKRLRTEIVKRLLDAGCSLMPDDIIITSGCVEATTLALQAVCRHGDTVAIGSPVYPTFLRAIEWMGLKVLEIPYNSEGMNLDVLDYAIRQNPVHACITIANFNNPLGSLLPNERKHQLVELLAKHEIPLIEDDVYGDLCFGSNRPAAIKSFDKYGLVLYCSSFSKTLAPGYRVGWIAPGRFLDKVLHLKTLLNIATASPTQLTVTEFLTNGGYDRHLRTLRKVYARQIAKMLDAVGRYFPHGTHVNPPEGGYILWVVMPDGFDSFKLYELALNEGISIAPGNIFTLSDRYRNCFRLNAALWSEQIEQALETLGRLAKTLIK
ncbi:winged helix-turn-helix transcriptional regulator with amino acid aminotransferase domain, GntR family [Geotalea daltonii FRC-32]|uniref:Winged helix-turn-helix transcriptional regulator with amino acid aminotransferase domain, GntR family n=1 Tax=Geotalea daltonii (strain DSM 22248 / JCM 15807 / FRC-32) TaxID=316067 RepID=B9M7B2_GEODF|nr:winged helix-turn-helix transcriptional regulator with amino acid aminotransferase domain, GntR family [Geotalea daltonii FRC-32]